MDIMISVLMLVSRLGADQALSEDTGMGSPVMAALPYAGEHMTEEKNESWKIKVKEFHEDNLTRAPGGIVFCGDSITAGFPLKEMMPAMNPANRGIGGDAIWALLRRLNESAYELKPSKVFVMIGINDVFINEMSIPEYHALYAYMFRELRKNCPEAEIIVQSLLPVRGEFAKIASAKLNATVVELNKELKAIASELEMTYLDLHPAFCRETGELKTEYSDDGCHPNKAGYELWTRMLEELLASAPQPNG